MSAPDLDAIVIGGSAGSLDVLLTVLSALPPSFPLPIIIVVHLVPTGPSVLWTVLADRCALPVREAEDKEPIMPGTVYVAPPNYHLLIERHRAFALSVDDPVMFSRPSIDVLFASAADVYGGRLAGLVLSGANEDGADGLAQIHRAGGRALVQAPGSAMSATMPEAALRRVGPGARPLSDREIAPLLAAMAGVTLPGPRP